MLMFLRPALVPFVLVLLATLSAAQARADDWSPKAAATYLDGRADYWLKWSGAARGQGTACISCHTTLPYALARPALGVRLGETTPGAVEQRFLDNVKKRVANWDKIVADATADKNPFVPFYPKERKPSALGTEAVLNALVLVNHDARRNKLVLSAATKQALNQLWPQQQANGAWRWLDFGLKPWEQQDSSYFGASLAALAVGTAGKDYYEHTAVQPKVAALKQYLKAQFPQQPLHHRVTALWAASRLPGILDEVDRQKLIDELLKLQEADGGWSLPKLGRTAKGPGNWKSHGVHPEGAVSDGYATGLVMLALKRAGVAADHPKLRKAVGWLTTNQRDGTWPANYPNRPRDPQTNVGRFLRDAATGFAILALCE